MARHEISPVQIRGLILLLVLGPLIPTALMLRLMFVMVEDARTETRDQMKRAYDASLELVTNSLTHQLETTPPSRVDAPRQIVKFYRGYLEPGAVIRVVDETGKALTASHPPKESPLATAKLGAPFAGWKVEIYPLANNPLMSTSDDGIAYFIWPVALAVGANLVIAGAAGFALHRQLRMQELKNSTLATVTHEFKTPVASMRMLLDTLIEGRYRGEDQMRDYLGLLAKENLRLGRLIENFLALSRMEHGVHVFHRESVDPNKVAQTALDAMRLKTGGESLIEFRPEQNLPRILADSDALDIVLMNLLDNAWKYTGEEKKISLSTQLTDNSVEFAVEDNGQGIEKSEHQKIFRRFYQVDQKLTRNAEGAGLGLSIVKHIVEAHGGRVSVESGLGRGSRFLVTIPVA